MLLECVPTCAKQLDVDALSVAAGEHGHLILRASALHLESEDVPAPAQNPVEQRAWRVVACGRHEWVVPKVVVLEWIAFRVIARNTASSIN